jgi:hypothetical protein
MCTNTWTNLSTILCVTRAKLKKEKATAEKFRLQKKRRYAVREGARSKFSNSVQAQLKLTQENTWKKRAFNTSLICLIPLYIDPLIERRLPLSVLCQLPWPLSARPLSTLPSVALSFSSDLLDVNIIGCRALLTTLLSCRRYLPIALTASGPPEFGRYYLANDVAFSSEVFFHPRRPLSVFVNGRCGFRGHDLVDSAFLS